MYWEKLASEANIELKNSDVICETMREKKFSVNLESFDGKMKHLRMSEYNVYTDGLTDNVGLDIVFTNTRLPPFAFAGIYKYLPAVLREEQQIPPLPSLSTYKLP